MGHQINHYTTKATTEKNLKSWISRITDCAYDPQENSCYHGNLTIHENKVYKDYDEALAAIEKYDNGWYDDHIVKYYGLSDEGRKKVQEWNEKRDVYIEAHSIHKRTSKFIGCPECGSKLNLGYIRGEKCPLCGTDLRPDSTIEKVKWYDGKVKECAKKYRQEFWLAKIEYHC